MNLSLRGNVSGGKVGDTPKKKIHKNSELHAVKLYKSLPH